MTFAQNTNRAIAALHTASFVALIIIAFSVKHSLRDVVVSYTEELKISPHEMYSRFLPETKPMTRATFIAEFLSLPMIRNELPTHKYSSYTGRTQDEFIQRTAWEYDLMQGLRLRENPKYKAWSPSPLIISVLCFGVIVLSQMAATRISRTTRFMEPSTRIAPSQ